MYVYFHVMFILRNYKKKNNRKCIYLFDMDLRDTLGDTLGDT